MTFKLQSGETKQKAGDEADQSRNRDGRPVRHIKLVHKDRGGVRTDREKGAVPQRDLSAIPGQDIQPHESDCRAQNHRRLKHMVVAEKKWQYTGHGHDHGDPYPGQLRAGRVGRLNRSHVRSNPRYDDFAE